MTYTFGPYIPPSRLMHCARCGGRMCRTHTSRPEGEAVCMACRRAASTRNARRFVPQPAQCPVCGRGFTTSRHGQVYCTTECRERRRRSSPKQKSTKARGYGHQHQKRRKELLPAAIGTMCPLRVSRNCTGIMVDPRKMDLDHSVPHALGGTEGDRIVCSSCNRSRGASLGNRIRRGVSPVPTRTTLAW